MKISVLTIGDAAKARKAQSELWLEYLESVSQVDRRYLVFEAWLSLIVKECRQLTSVAGKL